jgi:hypothetical protein
LRKKGNKIKFCEKNVIEGTGDNLVTQGVDGHQDP